MRLYAIGLCGLFVLLKLFVRFYIYKPIHARASFARHNEVLKLIDLLAWTALIAAFFLLVNISKGLVKALTVVAALTVFDAILRFFFLEREVRRLRASSPKWTQRGARKHVRKRAQATMFQ